MARNLQRTLRSKHVRHLRAPYLTMGMVNWKDCNRADQRIGNNTNESASKE